MRIQHNIAALNSYRNLTGNNNAVSKNLEKLSSGFRINRAGDDAAGLAISEKMRAQITGLNTAQKNAQDGVSLVQTAEGALTEVHSMLNRMVELADQSANGTYDNAVDRANLQKEMSSLKSEIDRIADATNFNGINLLDGSLSKAGGSDQIVGLKGAEATPIAATAASSRTSAHVWTGDQHSVSNATIKVDYYGNDGKAHTIEIKDITLGSDAEKSANIVAAKINEKANGEFTVKGESDGKLTFTSSQVGESKFKIKSVTGTAGGASTVTINDTPGAGNKIDLTFSNVVNPEFTIDGQKFQVVKEGDVIKEGYKAIHTVDGKAFTTNNLNEVVDQLKNFGITATAGTNKLTFNKADGLTLQIGDTSADFNQMKVSIEDMHTTALGIKDVDISTQEGAKTAIESLKTAINSVSSTRGDLGAIQNRLEHTINNLSVTAENMTAAESRIRDVDMANEMMAYTKNNILVQASQAMLAQANQLPQGVLQLLQ